MDKATLDFTTMTDRELLFGYKRVNRTRFPQNFAACREEIARRGLDLPEKFEIPCVALGALLAFADRAADRVLSLVGSRPSRARA